MAKTNEPESTIPSTSENKNKSGQIPDEVIDQLLAGYKSPEDLLGPDGLIKQLMGRLISRAMRAELSHHLGPCCGRRSERRGHGSAPPGFRAQATTFWSRSRKGRRSGTYSDRRRSRRRCSARPSPSRIYTRPARTDTRSALAGSRS